MSASNSIATAPTATLTVSQLLNQYIPQFVLPAGRVSSHVLNLLARIVLCRTAALSCHKLKCLDCEQTLLLYNSCGERCCPQCSGTIRRDWLRQAARNILPGIDYFQIVLTVGDSLDELTLRNRSRVYALLMRAAWAAISGLLAEQGIGSGATLVLHTWNQRLRHHPHVHALLPAGGLSSGGDRWCEIDEAGRQQLQQKLGKRFRDLWVKGMQRLHRRGELDLNTSSLLPQKDPATFAALLATIAPGGFNVMVQAPAEGGIAGGCRPEHLLKYLARYISGGPISDGRLISHAQGKVKFRARSLEKPAAGQQHAQVEIEVTGVEFVRRWSLHILPKRFWRIRHYGGHSGPRRTAWLKRCGELLQQQQDASKTGEAEPSAADRLSDQLSDRLSGSAIDNNVDNNPDSNNSDSNRFDGEEVADDESAADLPEIAYRCPQCQRPMVCVSGAPRPGWRDTFSGPHRPAWYAQPAPRPDMQRAVSHRAIPPKPPP